MYDPVYYLSTNPELQRKYDIAYEVAKLPGGDTLVETIPELNNGEEAAYIRVKDAQPLTKEASAHLAYNLTISRTRAETRALFEKARELQQQDSALCDARAEHDKLFMTKEDWKPWSL